MWVLLWRLPKDEVPFVIVNPLIQGRRRNESGLELVSLVMGEGFGCIWKDKQSQVTFSRLNPTKPSEVVFAQTLAIGGYTG